MAYIRKLASGWRAEVQKHGSRASKVLPTKREAQAWALEQEAKAGSLSKGWRTFDEAAIKYEKEVSVKKDGKVWEARRLGVMRDHFAGKPLGAIDAPDIAAWRDWRLQTVSGSTVLRETNLLKHIFHTARDEWRWMEHDPFRGVKLPKENAPRTALWGWREIRRVLRAGQQSGGKTAEVAVAFHISLRTAMGVNPIRISLCPSRQLHTLIANSQGFLPFGALICDRATVCWSMAWRVMRKRVAKLDAARPSRSFMASKRSYRFRPSSSASHARSKFASSSARMRECTTWRQ